jgi:hypothetical protein
MPRIVLLAILTTAITAAEPAPPALGDDGVAIAVDRLGTLVLAWPAMQDAAYHRTRPTAVHRAADGRSATLDYAGGGRVVARLAGDGVDLAVEQAPSGADGLCVEMMLPPAVRQGWTWSCDAATGPFPATTPEPPHFYGGGATAFALAAGGRRALAITAPAGAYQQLTDNRAWNWDVCCWRSVVPLTGPVTQHYAIVR